VEEVLSNLPDFPLLVSGEWVRLRSELLLMEDEITLDRPAVFSARKDRPILFSAFAWADILLTLDSADFGDLLGTSFYGMPVLRPANSYTAKERPVVYESRPDAHAPNVQFACCCIHAEGLFFGRC
jgi:hypothetical protein